LVIKVQYFTLLVKFLVKFIIAGGSVSSSIISKLEKKKNLNFLKNFDSKYDYDFNDYDIFYISNEKSFLKKNKKKRKFNDFIKEENEDDNFFYPETNQQIINELFENLEKTTKFYNKKNSIMLTKNNNFINVTFKDKSYEKIDIKNTEYEKIFFNFLKKEEFEKEIENKEKEEENEDENDDEEKNFKQKSLQFVLRNINSIQVN
jgi:hypothetical protein